MQAKQFAYERLGVPIRSDLLADIKRQNSSHTYPFLYSGTSQVDYAEAKFVLSREATSATTYGDLDTYRFKQHNKQDNDSDDQSRFSQCDDGKSGHNDVF